MTAGESWKAVRIVPKDNPCKDCGKRTWDCHGKCPDYAKYVEKKEQIRRKRALRRQVQDAIDDAMRRLPGKRNI